MAKKKTANKTTKKAPAEQTTTYSTRLNDAQRSVLEEAAEIAGVSTSKFIRDAALKAAADTLNASGKNEAAILSTLLSLADVIKRPQATVSHYSSEMEHTIERTISISNSGCSLQAHITDTNGNELDFVPVEITGNTLTTIQMKSLCEIAANCPITFSEAFRRAMEGTSDSQLKFTPIANPQAVLED